MKTPQQIREMAIKVIAHVKPEIQLVSESALKQTIEAIQYIQKDLLESTSEDHKFHWNNLTPHDQITLTSYGASEKAWQACALFHKAQIDTLKQRELGYQSDLRQKCEEIEKLNKELIEFKKINQSEAILNTSLHRKNKELTEKLNSALRLAVDMETKYQEAVKDIEFLTSHLTDSYDSSFDEEYKKVNVIREKYILKQESKE